MHHRSEKQALPLAISGCVSISVCVCVLDCVIGGVGSTIMRTIRSLWWASMACKEARSSNGCQKSKRRPKGRKRRTPLLSHHTFLQHSPAIAPLRALNAASALHGWWVMGNTKTSSPSKKKQQQPAIAKLCDKEQSALESSPVYGLRGDSIHPQQRCSQNLIEWKFMETSMEDGLLGRAALSRNESGWDWAEKKDQNLSRKGWKEPAPSGHSWRRDWGPWKDLEHVADGDLSPQQTYSKLRSTARDLDAEDDKGIETELTEETFAADCTETSYLDLELVESGFVSRRLRNRWKTHACFPPPLSSLMTKGCSHLPHQMSCVLLQPIRSNGRFVLQQVKVAPQIHFQPIRTNNRLVLQLIRPEEEEENQSLSQQPKSEEPAVEHLCSATNIRDGDAHWIDQTLDEIYSCPSKFSVDTSAVGDFERANEPPQELDFSDKFTKTANSKIDLSGSFSGEEQEEEEEACGTGVMVMGAVQSSCSVRDIADIVSIDVALDSKSLSSGILEQLPSEGGCHFSVDSQRPQIESSAPQDGPRLLEGGIGMAHSFLQVSLLVSGFEVLQQSRCTRFDLFEDDGALPIWDRQCITSS